MFSRSAQAEAEVKSFGVSKQAAIRIHERLQHEVEQTLRASGLPIIRSTEATQRGATFGRRLANAIADCWSQGFQKLVIVGGDTPELSASDIVRAQLALEAGRPTLGKDFRGGSFLIGLLREGFRQNQFAELPWQTSRIACALKEELNYSCADSEAEVFELIQRADCNTRPDLERIARRISCGRWLHLLLTSTGCVNHFETSISLVSRFGESRTKRGPPTQVLFAA